MLSRYPTADNLKEFKRCKANGRRIRHIAKTKSWMKYLSSINSYANTRKVYNRARILKAQPASPLPLVSSLGTTLESHMTG